LKVVDFGSRSGGGSLISGTGETLTARLPETDARPTEDLATPETHSEAGNGSNPNGSTANGSGPDSPSLVGQTVEGIVTGITHFGAFVNLDSGQAGLIHISEIAYEYVRDVRDHVNLNERVRVKVLQVNPANGKFDLSLKQTREAPAAVLPKWRRGKRDKILAEGADPVFEEKLSKFMKSSEERLLDVKRNLESKRGGRFK
jgi:S1 RNA binding domain protein